MYKVLIDGKIEEKHIAKQKSQTAENSDTKDDIWDNTIPLTKPILNNSQESGTLQEIKNLS